MTIRQLPDSLANKIAAGEVVERPSSVVKELVENSIDAHSKTIKIELVEAGLTEIKITDDGDGISEADVKKAFLRHATSKIMYDEDLFHIRSLGFRGEALASIASVSKLTIKTSQGDQAATQLELEGGKVIKESIGDARKGTEITVQQLFYNTPARLKYMKSIHTELSHITDLINRYALAHPHIRFEVYHNGNKVFITNGSNNIQQVISQIYGMKVAREMIPVEVETDDFHVKGFIGKPEITRASRHYMTTIVNGRYIRNQPLNYGIIRAYETLLPRHRFPIVVLQITLDPILVDVNVHPTKLEVRFSKEKELVQLVENMIKEQFRQETLIPSVQYPNQPKKQVEQHKLDFDQYVKQVEKDEENLIEQVEKEEKEVQSSAGRTFHRQDIPNEALMGLYKTKDKTVIKEDYDNEKASDQINQDDSIVASENRIPTLYPIGQYRGTYILAQNEDGLYMIDQHAAQERIKYELFKDKLGKPINELQSLLIPLSFDFTNEEKMFIEKHLGLLEAVGLYLEAFGDKQFIVRSYPNWFPQGEEEDIIRDMVEQIIQTGEINIEKIREEVAILMSCKRSIKANHYLNEHEMNRLLEDLRQTTDPFTCPHGRPVIIQFTNYEVEKMFKRIM